MFSAILLPVVSALLAFLCAILFARPNSQPAQVAIVYTPVILLLVLLIFLYRRGLGSELPGLTPGSRSPRRVAFATTLVLAAIGATIVSAKPISSAFHEGSAEQIEWRKTEVESARKKIANSSGVELVVARESLEAKLDSLAWAEKASTRGWLAVALMGSFVLGSLVVIWRNLRWRHQPPKVETLVVG